MTPDEIVKALRWMVKETEFTFAAENLNGAADLIESLQAQLAEVVEAFESAAHNGNILCEFCGANCIDAGNDTGGDTEQCGCFKCRCPQEAGKGETK